MPARSEAPRAGADAAEGATALIPAADTPAGSFFSATALDIEGEFARTTTAVARFSKLAPLPARLQGKKVLHADLSRRAASLVRARSASPGVTRGTRSDAFVDLSRRLSSESTPRARGNARLGVSERRFELVVDVTILPPSEKAPPSLPVPRWRKRVHPGCPRRRFVREISHDICTRGRRSRNSREMFEMAGPRFFFSSPAHTSTKALRQSDDRCANAPRTHKVQL